MASHAKAIRPPIRNSMASAQTDFESRDLGGYNFEFQSMRNSISSASRACNSIKPSKSSNDIPFNEVIIQESNQQDLWANTRKLSLGSFRKTAEYGFKNLFSGRKEDTLDENFMSPTFMLHEEKKEYGTKSPKFQKSEIQDTHASIESSNSKLILNSNSKPGKKRKNIKNVVKAYETNQTVS
jgi:hypothetical protein